MFGKSWTSWKFGIKPNSLCFWCFDLISFEFFVLFYFLRVFRILFWYIYDCLERITNSLLSCYVELDRLWWKNSDKRRIKVNRSLKGIYAMFFNWHHQSAIKWWLILMSDRDGKVISVLFMAFDLIFNLWVPIHEKKTFVQILPLLNDKLFLHKKKSDWLADNGYVWVGEQIFTSWWHLYITSSSHNQINLYIWTSVFIYEYF